MTVKRYHSENKINDRAEELSSILVGFSDNYRPYFDHKWCSPPLGSFEINCDTAVGACIMKAWSKIIKKMQTRDS
jgi:hypothetical protein